MAQVAGVASLEDHPQGKEFMMISGVGSNISSLASQLFSKLDSKSQGYIEQTDLQEAFDKMSSSSSSSSNVEEIFSSLDSDSDGKVTESEMSSSLTRLAEELDNQLNSTRMSQAMGGMGGPGGMGGMPPGPPPPGGPGGGGSEDDAGFTLEELQGQLEETGSTDSERASLISSVIENFDEADTDGDGKVSFKEAMALDQAKNGNDAASKTASATQAGSSTGNELAVMMRMMQLAQSYGVFGTQQESALSVVA